MNEQDFMRESQAAVERMREMNSRAVPGNNAHQMPPFPSFVQVQNRQNTQNQSEKTQQAKPQPINEQKQMPRNKEPQPRKQNSGFLGGLDLPFLDIFTKDGDTSLIVGLLLILMSEKADKKLLFALIYILL